ncbi:MAG: hydantoinase/oxoprolinase family protein [Acidimicrobiia bacterium]|nr:hydantoinase/oxoprolinase family protein [Acidimicrobiia bacterium]
MTLGVDVGGTFTDLVWWDGRRLRTAKTSTTSDQSDAVLAGSTALLGGRRADALLHGTTVATNALLERRGARVALITTAGFEDVIEIARQDRPSLYDSHVDRSEPLVKRSARHGISRASGEEVWTNAEVADLVQRVIADAPDSVAVSLLYGYAAMPAERRIGDALPAGVAVSLSSEVAAEFREYERTATTVVNAFLAPETGAYLRNIRDRVQDAGLPPHVMVMRSSGGLIPVDRAASLPVSILLSGPAGGVVAAAAMGDLLGRRRLISFDMGGTSTDVARIDGGVPEVSYERQIEGFAIRMPSVAIHTVGAGGGSVGWIDAGGALRVGPRSAGAHPGPAAYGRGGIEATVTDANVHLGRIGVNSRLGGELALDGSASTAALHALGAEIRLDATQTASGIVEVVEARMDRAIRKVSVEEGADPRGAMLVAFGGAGGLHATALARRLDMAGVIVPPLAGVFSAFGLLLAPPRVDTSRSVTVTAETASALTDHLRKIRDIAREEFYTDTGHEPIELQLVADTRYVGQAHETPVAVDLATTWEGLAQRFHDAHQKRNGFARPTDPVEVVTVRAAAIGSPALTLDDLPGLHPDGDPQRPGREVVDPRVGAVERVDVWWRPGLNPGSEIIGPAIIEETDATTYLGPGERMRVHESGAMEIEW